MCGTTLIETSFVYTAHFKGAILHMIPPLPVVGKRFWTVVTRVHPDFHVNDPIVPLVSGQPLSTGESSSTSWAKYRVVIGLGGRGSGVISAPPCPATLLFN